MEPGQDSFIHALANVIAILDGRLRQAAMMLEDLEAAGDKAGLQKCIQSTQKQVVRLIELLEAERAKAGAKKAG